MNTHFTKVNTLLTIVNTPLTIVNTPYTAVRNLFKYFICGRPRLARRLSKSYPVLDKMLNISTISQSYGNGESCDHSPPYGSFFVQIVASLILVLPPEARPILHVILTHHKL